MEVFVLQHVHEFEDGGEDVKMIGIYSTREAAEQAIQRVVLQSGFREVPDGFSVGRYRLDEDHWTEGYITV